MSTVIIGSGFSGLGAAIRLKREGIDDFVVLERAGDLGGTWRDNTYPGCGCDVESHLYSFSFALEPGWTHRFSRQPEIWKYLRRCSDEFGVTPHIRFNHEVTGAAWDEPVRRWRIDTSQGTMTAQYLVLAIGPFSTPVVPDVPGLEHFVGPAFHTARWDHRFDPSGRRVAVIGTGASAAQLIPEIQRQVAKLYVFQRTAPWVIPRRNVRIPGWHRFLYKRIPHLQRAVRSIIYAYRELPVFLFRHPEIMKYAQRAMGRQLKKSVADPALRAKLTPSFILGCKRTVLSSAYYPAIAQPNVEVITGGIREARARSIVGDDGIERSVDAIVFGTGFRPSDPPIARHVRGRQARSLSEVWLGSPRAHVSTTVTGFPNLFLLLGPNAGVGHGSVVYMAEAQIDHFIGALRYMRRHGIETVEPRAEAQAAFVAGVDQRMQGTVWTSGGCSSWYLDATGRNSLLWPDWSWSFYRRVATFRPAEYVALAPFTRAGDPGV
jgi:cation diffusion facilitator CzcD-associated flavoprotein CzcO